MAVDFVHTAQLVDAVIAVLKGADGAAHTGGLPANWFADGRDALETPLVLLEHGDLADYPSEEALTAACPGITVRGLGPRPAARQATGGVQDTEEIIRVVHLRTFDQCRDDAGAVLRNVTRARERYAKLLSAALFHDPNRKLAVIDAAGTRTEPTLTCTDGAGAQVVSVAWEGWDLGREGSPGEISDVSAIRALNLNIFAIACDLRVLVRSGGPA